MYYSDHTCFYVTNADKSRQFYESALNFHQVEERRPRENVRMLFLSDESGTYKLQLIEGKAEPDALFGHIALISTEFEASYQQHLEQKHVRGRMLTQPQQRSYFILDPDGYEIEILETKK